MWVMVTVAPGTAAPVASLTLPTTDPYSTCACTDGGITHAASSTTRTRIMIKLPPMCHGFARLRDSWKGVNAGAAGGAILCRGEFPHFYGGGRRRAGQR